MGMEIMNNNFQPQQHPFSFPAYSGEEQTNNGVIASESPSAATPSESQTSSSSHGVMGGGGGPSSLDARQTNFIAAELRRMQQVRDEENNALMQLLSRQTQQISSSSRVTSSSNSDGLSFNDIASSSNGNDAGNLFGSSSSQMMNGHNMSSHHMSNLDQQGPSGMMNSMGGSTVPHGMDSLRNMNGTLGSQAAVMNNFMASSFMKNTSSSAMNGIDGMGNMNNQMNVVNNIQAPSTTSTTGGNNGTSSSSGFNKIPQDLTSFPFDSSSQMGNFINGQGGNMNGGIGMDFLQKSNQHLPSAGLHQSSQANCGTSTNSASNMGGSNNPLFQSNMTAGIGGAQSSANIGMPNNNGMGAAGQQLQQQRFPQEVQVNHQEDPGWEEQYKALRAYQLQFGHCKVPARFKANAKLGRWVMTQRRQFTLLMQGFPSALTAERIRRLEALGFTWSVRPEPVTTWNAKFQELKAYKATYGNCMVPQRYQANPQLGTWVHTQRRQYKLMSEGKKSSMTKEKADALDSIGFFWAAKNLTSTSSSASSMTVTNTLSDTKLPGGTSAMSNNMLPLENAGFNGRKGSDGSDSSQNAKAA